MTAPLTLTTEERGALLQAQGVLRDLIPQIDHLATCGHDCQRMRLDAVETLRRIDALLTLFPAASLP
jgi:hypothetical protein